MRLFSLYISCFISKTRIVLVAIALASSIANAQQVSVTTTDSITAPVRDVQALQILSQVLTTSGWGQAVLQTPINDFKAGGSITFHWTDTDVIGSVQLLGKGIDEFRQTVAVPDGTRDFAARYGLAQEKIGSTLRKIPYQNSANVSLPTFPLPAIAAAYTDTSSQVRFLGQVSDSGRTFYAIEIRRNLDPKQDPDGDLSKFRTTEYFIDPASLQVVKTQSLFHADDNVFDTYPLVYVFSDFRPINGIQVPFAIGKEIGGQRTWDIKLSSFAFNSNVSDTDFTIQ